MKSTSLTLSKNNNFENCFKSLNNNEMNTLRGGTVPPLPPDDGDDYPINPFANSTNNGSASSSQQELPIL